MPHPRWPLFDLRLRTPRLELTPATDADLEELAEVAAAGIHPPEAMPFATPWSDCDDDERARRVLQWGWRQRADLTPARWAVGFAVRWDGRAVGVQDLAAHEFATVRAVETGSWLGRTVQGRGIGTEMRAAVLHLAFAGLGARRAVSGAFDDNAASLGVSRALGYEENGDEWRARGLAAEPARIVRLELTAPRWAEASARRGFEVEVEGLAACRPLLVGAPGHAGA